METTKKLAERLGVRPNTILQGYQAFGHYKGYEPTGAEKRQGTGKRQYTWDYIGNEGIK